MHLQRPAALLLRRNRDLAAVLAQDANRCFVEPTEEHVLHAAGHQGYPMLGFAFSREHLADTGKEERGLRLGGQLGQLSQPA